MDFWLNVTTWIENNRCRIKENLDLARWQKVGGLVYNENCHGNLYAKM